MNAWLSHPDLLPPNFRAHNLSTLSKCHNSCSVGNREHACCRSAYLCVTWFHVIPLLRLGCPLNIRVIPGSAVNTCISRKKKGRLGTSPTSLQHFTFLVYVASSTFITFASTILYARICTSIDRLWAQIKKGLEALRRTANLSPYITLSDDTLNLYLFCQNFTLSFNGRAACNRYDLLRISYCYVRRWLEVWIIV